MGHQRSISVPALLALCLIGSVVGCGVSSSAPVGNDRVARGGLKVLGVEYARFMAEHDSRPPADQQEFVAFLETRKPHIAGLKNLDQLLVSPRDNEPLVIHYGKAAPPADESGFPIVACESTGFDGRCLVANTRGGVQEVVFDQRPTHLRASN